MTDGAIPHFTIVGAGPVGALMALLLARRDHGVRLLERRADPRVATPERGRSINLALAARGIRALEQAGVMGRISPHLVSLRGRMVHEPQGLHFLPYGIHASEVIYSISRELLNRLLIEAVGERGSIELQFDTHCLDVDPEARTLQVQRRGLRGTQAFQCLFGADGAGSAVRRALQHRNLTRAHDEELSHDYKELQIAACAALQLHALHVWPRGGYMLIALPNADQSFTATLFLPRHGDPGFDQLRSARSVCGFFQQSFPDVEPLIADLPGQFERHPQGRLGTVHCERWQLGGRVLLLGDAAHAIVPFHGQGLNCGFEDCGQLDRLLDTHADLGAAFADFERQRRPEVLAIAEMALENYTEMRAGVRSLQFQARQRLAAELERHFPERFIPRYSMVMFHPEIGYAEAQRRGRLQQRLLDELEAHCGLGPLTTEGLAYARALLDTCEL